MGQNKIADGDSIMIAIPAGGCESGGRRDGAAIVPGKTILVGNDTVGIPQSSYAAATSGNVTLHLEGIFSNIKLKTGDTPAVGDKLYHDNDPGELTTTAEGNVFAGHAMSTAVVGTSDTTVTIRLKG
jgi:hypothetical protein